MAKPYRPSNGTEGVSFIDYFCGRCERDRAFREERGDSCPIVAASFAFDIHHPSYPKEWIEDDDGPRCTAFVPEGNDVPYRCPDTLDMFGAIKKCQ